MMTPETVLQYQHEERALIHKRILSAKNQMGYLLNVMCRDIISPEKNVIDLREALAKHHKADAFLECHTMGDIVKESLNTLNSYDYVTGFQL